MHKLHSPLFIMTMLFAMHGSAAHAVAPPQSNTISVGQLWSLPTAAPAPGNLTPPGAVDIYGTITNQGSLSDAVVGVTSKAGSKAVLVVWAKALELSNPLPLSLPNNGKTVTLGPETQFLRLIGGEANWKAGNSFPVTLHFQHAPDVKTSVIVKAK